MIYNMLDYSSVFFFVNNYSCFKWFYNQNHHAIARFLFAKIHKNSDCQSFWEKQLKNSQKMRTFEKKYYFCT